MCVVLESWYPALGVSRTKQDSNTAETCAEVSRRETEPSVRAWDGFIIIHTHLGSIIYGWTRMDIFYGLLLELGYVIQ